MRKNVCHDLPIASLFLKQKHHSIAQPFEENVGVWTKSSSCLQTREHPHGEHAGNSREHHQGITTVCYVLSHSEELYIKTCKRFQEYSGKVFLKTKHLCIALYYRLTSHLVCLRLFPIPRDHGGNCLPEQGALLFLGETARCKYKGDRQTLLMDAGGLLSCLWQQTDPHPHPAP